MCKAVYHRASKWVLSNLRGCNYESNIPAWMQGLSVSVSWVRFSKLTKRKHDWARLSTFEHHWARLSTIEHDWARLSTIEHVLARLSTFEHVWARLSTFERVWARLSTFEHIWARLSTFEHTLPSQAKELFSTQGCSSSHPCTAVVKNPRC